MSAMKWLFPSFSVEFSHIEPTIDSILQKNRNAIQKRLEEPGPIQWNNFHLILEELEDELERYWSSISHLHAVMDSEELRKVYQQVLPKLSEYATELGQNEKLYHAYQILSSAAEPLDDAKRMILQHKLRDFKLSGVHLPKEKKEKFLALEKELSLLSNQFEHHLLDATDAWSYGTEDVSLFAGLPAHALSLAKQLAEQHQKPGYWFNLEFPSYNAIMTFADNRDLRRTFYEAYVTRASDKGPQAGQFDNSQVMVRILQIRQELAQLLEYKNYAEVSLATKMAKTPEEVLLFLRTLAQQSRMKATEEYETLKRFAKEHSGIEPFEPWDLAYFSEKIRQANYGISEEALRPYFPLPRVLEGLFSIVERLFGVTLVLKPDVQTWHPDASCYGLLNTHQQEMGAIYFDLFARPKKRGGAWMSDACHRRRCLDGVIQLPIGFVTCNFTPPCKGEPSLLTHQEVVTLFHEFGHALQHLLTRMEWLDVSGINGVPWDSVELCSQFLEHWCWEKEALPTISSHVKDHSPLPDELLEKLMAAKNFQSGLQILRQVEFSVFDMLLHMDEAPRTPADIQTLLDAVRKEISLIPVPEFHRFQHGFAHIFSGGYAAGYYSYKWAEVLSSDAFSRFEKEGVFNKKVGDDFKRTFLEQGGAKEPLDLFVEFRGRAPNTDALLRHLGIVSELKG